MSTPREPLFKKIDSFIFKQVDVFKSSPVYSKLQEPLSLMDDELRLVVNNTISLVMVIIPLVFIGIFVYMNWGLKKEIELKKEILRTGADIILNRGEVNNVALNLITMSPVDSDQALLQRLKSIAQSTSIDPSKVQVSQFNMEPSFARSNKINAMIGVSRFSANDLTNLLTGLINTERMKIAGMNLRKNEQEGQLEGTISIRFNSMQGMGGDEGGGGEEAPAEE